VVDEVDRKIATQSDEQVHSGTRCSSTNGESLLYGTKCFSFTPNISSTDTAVSAPAAQTMQVLQVRYAVVQSEPMLVVLYIAREVSRAKI
jgi:hypothetical protein